MPITTSKLISICTVSEGLTILKSQSQLERYFGQFCSEDVTVCRWSILFPILVCSVLPSGKTSIKCDKLELHNRLPTSCPVLHFTWVFRHRLPNYLREPCQVTVREGI